MKVAVVEILDRDGTSRRVVPVDHWPVTIGRAVDCDVVLDDPHVAAHHATVDETDGGMVLRVDESINGATWPGTHLTAGNAAALPPGQIVHLGGTRLRVRRTSDALLAEERLVPEPAASRIPLALLVLLLTGWIAFREWLALDTGSRVTDYLQVVLPVWLLLVIWCGVWALASKLFRHRFEFWPHVRIAVVYTLAANLVELTLPGLSYMLGLPIFSRVSLVVSTGVFCAMVVAHVARVLPTRRRLAAITMGSLYATGVAMMLMFTYQTQDRLFPELYVTALAPPALRLASPVTTSTFIEEARSLKDKLDAHINDDDGDDEFGYGMLSAAGR